LDFFAEGGINSEQLAGVEPAAVGAGDDEEDILRLKIIRSVGLVSSGRKEEEEGEDREVGKSTSLTKLKDSRTLSPSSTSITTTNTPHYIHFTW